MKNRSSEQQSIILNAVTQIEVECIDSGGVECNYGFFANVTERCKRTGDECDCPVLIGETFESNDLAQGETKVIYSGPPRGFTGTLDIDDGNEVEFRFTSNGVVRTITLVNNTSSEEQSIILNNVTQIEVECIDAGGFECDYDFDASVTERCKTISHQYN
ncbi:hypothetical protein ACSVDA_22815 [Cytobacillus sp. Hm23]